MVTFKLHLFLILKNNRVVEGFNILTAADKNECRKRTLSTTQLKIPRKRQAEKPLVNQLHLVKEDVIKKRSKK